MRLSLLIYAISMTYYVTLVLVKGHVFHSFRAWLKLKTPWLVKGPVQDRLHFIDCRLCVGTWASCFIAILYLSLPTQIADILGTVFVVMTGAYFLAQQERR